MFLCFVFHLGANRSHPLILSLRQRSVQLSYHSQLMQEYSSNTDRANKADNEEPHSEKTSSQCMPIGKFILNHTPGNNPSYQQTSEEAAEGQQDVRREEVAAFHQTQSKQSQLWNSA